MKTNKIKQLLKNEILNLIHLLNIWIIQPEIIFKMKPNQKKDLLKKIKYLNSWFIIEYLKERVKFKGIM